MIRPLLLLVVAFCVWIFSITSQSATTLSPDQTKITQLEATLAPAALADFQKLPASVQTLMAVEADFKTQLQALALTRAKAATKTESREALFSYDRRDRCDDEQDPTTCIQHCAERYSNGTCRTYGADYCAPGATCVEFCSERYSNGTCRTYGADICGQGSVSCTVNCVERYSNGTCRTYGADVCY